MKRAAVYLFLMVVVLCSCRQDPQKLLAGKWHVVKFQNNLQMLVGRWNAVAMENPEMDDFFKNGQVYIDTVGKHNDAATNMRLYGVANMDSMRVILQKQYDSAKNMQDEAVTSTSFIFGNDGIAILSFHGNIDSSSWYIDSAGHLVLDDMNDSGKGDRINMEILTVNDSVLKLKFMENNSYSIVTFHPDGTKEAREVPVVETYFTFRPDSVVVLSFNGVADSNRWYLANDSTIMVSSLNKKDAAQMPWNILSLNNDKMAMKITESSSVSTLSFKREGK